MVCEYKNVIYEFIFVDYEYINEAAIYNFLFDAANFPLHY